ncbi:MAG: hypothetical protein Q4E74_03135 [Ruminococcus sp.]|nr:hypothetical protein [Ruminococcus sp.]
MITEDFRRQATEIRLCGQRNDYSAEEKRDADKRALEFFENALESGEFTDSEDIAWLMWSISDLYALMRDSENLYKNHIRFSEHLKTMSDPYLFWCVCDATQKFTLQLGGYNEFWYDLYRYACEKNKVVTCENEYIAFEAHRAALSRHKQFKCGTMNLNFAMNESYRFLQQVKNSEQYEFYWLINHSQLMTVFGAQGIPDITNICKDLSKPGTVSNYCCGEWQKLNAPRSAGNRANVAVCAVINALIDTGCLRKAEDFYKYATQKGLAHNAYIEKRIGGPKCH